MDVVAQWVRTSWTTLSRGGAEATRRNAVPVAFTLPEPGSPLSHEVVADEWTRFAPRWRVWHAEPERDDVELTEEDGALRVHLVPAPFGRPTRWRRPPAVRLAAGQWVRWRINYRFPAMCCGDPTYRQDTLNLAYGRVSTTVFHGKPTRCVDELVRLL
jgi:hypothetical protein